MKDLIKPFIAMAVLLVFTVFAFMLGIDIGVSTFSAEAISHGYAEYRADPKTGKTEFVWLTKPKAEQQANEKE